MRARHLSSFKSGERGAFSMSEPVDLTGMTPEQARRAVRAAARTMEIPKLFKSPPTSATKPMTTPTGAMPVKAKPGR